MKKLLLFSVIALAVSCGKDVRDDIPETSRNHKEIARDADCLPFSTAFCWELEQFTADSLVDRILAFNRSTLGAHFDSPELNAKIRSWFRDSLFIFPDAKNKFEIDSVDGLSRPDDFAYYSSDSITPIRFGENVLTLDHQSVFIQQDGYDILYTIEPCFKEKVADLGQHKISTTGKYLPDYASAGSTARVRYTKTRYRVSFNIYLQFENHDGGTPEYYALKVPMTANVYEHGK